MEAAQLVRRSILIAATVFYAVMLPLLLIAAVAAPAVAMDLQSIFGGEPKDNFNLIHVNDLAKLKASDAKVYIYDANPPDVRSSDGTIPGAKLLASSDDYDVANTLPADKQAKLVFYCHNPH